MGLSRWGTCHNPLLLKTNHHFFGASKSTSPFVEKAGKKWEIMAVQQIATTWLAHG
jgi:hypothetical protein